MAALADAQKCTAAAPTYAKGYSRLGFALYKLDRYTESIAAFTKGLELDPASRVMKERPPASARCRAVLPHYNIGQRAVDERQSDTETVSCLRDAGGPGRHRDAKDVLERPRSEGGLF